MPRRPAVPPSRRPAAPSRPAVPPSPPARDPPDTSGPEGLLQVLRTLAGDDAVPAAARTAAARAVLEAEGRLGKHQRPPEDTGRAVALSQASRGELEAELARLRAAHPGT